MRQWLTVLDATRTTRKRLSCGLLLVLALLLLVHAPGHAQSAIDEVMKSGDAVARAALVRNLDWIKAYARRHAPDGSGAYWAIVREVLEKGSVATRDGSARSLGSRSVELPRIDDAVKPVAGATAIDPSALKDLQRKLKDLDNERVLGGVQVERGAFREVVAIARREGDRYRSHCTGTLIDLPAAPAAGTAMAEPRIATVLTAAHCVCRDIKKANDRDWEDRVTPKWAYVVIGTDINLNAGGIEAAFPVRGFERLDDAACSGDIAGRDVAVVYFDPDKPHIGTLPSRMQPSRIATWQYLLSSENKDVQVVGYGLAEQKISGQKRLAIVPVTDAICASKGSKCSAGVEMLAIDPQAERDTCNGDSGGPAFVHSAGEKSILAGVTSRGGVCGTGGIYALITPRVLDWLEGMLVKPALCDAATHCTRRID